MDGSDWYKCVLCIVWVRCWEEAETADLGQERYFGNPKLKGGEELSTGHVRQMEAHLEISYSIQKGRTSEIEYTFRENWLRTVTILTNLNKPCYRPLSGGSSQKSLGWAKEIGSYLTGYILPSKMNHCSLRSSAAQQVERTAAEYSDLSLNLSVSIHRHC